MSWQEVHQLVHEDEDAHIISCCTHGNLLFCGRTDSVISVWNLDHLQEQGQLKGHKRSVLCLKSALYPGTANGEPKEFLFSSSSDNTIKIWNLAEFTCVCTITGHPGDIYSICLLDYLLCIGCQDTSIKFVDLTSVFQKIYSANGKHVIIKIQETFAETLKAHNGFVYSLYISKGTHVISASGDEKIMIWNIKDFVDNNEGKEGNNILASKSEYIPIQMKETQSEAEIVINTKAGAVFDVISDDKYVYSASQNGSVQVWDLDTGLLRRVLTGHSDQVLSLTQTKNHIISSSSDGVLKVWTKSNFYCTQTLDIGHFDRLAVLTAAGDSQPIFFSCFGNCVHIWALGDGASDEIQATPVQSVKVIPAPSLLRKSSGSISSSLILSMRDPLICALRTFISFKTICGSERFRDDCFEGAKFLWKLFEQYGFQAQLIEGATGKNPLVFARLGHDPKLPTVTVYGHYDVFPVKRAEWASDPFVLTGKNGYLYGRGTSDDKGPILAILFAAADLQANGGLPVNLSFVIEGEEEASSSGFVDAMEANLHWFDDTDVILLSNSVWLGENKPCLHYGLRGLLKINVTVTGAHKNLHSGVDGGAVNEPMIDLVNLLAGLIDVTGHVNIEGFYENIAELSDDEKKLYEGLDFDIEAYKKSLGVSKLLSDDPRELLMKRWRFPTLSMHSVGYKNQQSSASIIPAAVTGMISVRIVPNQTAEEVFKHIHKHLTDKFALFNSSNSVEVELASAGDWWLGDPKSKFFKAAEESLETVWEQKVVYSREGGTIPITNRLEKILNAPAIHLPIGQSTDACHLHDERIRVENLMKGKHVVSEFFCRLAKS